MHEAMRVPIDDNEEPWGSMRAWRCTRPDYIPIDNGQGLPLGTVAMYGGLPWIVTEYGVDEGAWCYSLLHGTHEIVVRQSCAEGWCWTCGDTPEEREAYHGKGVCKRIREET